MTVAPALQRLLDALPDPTRMQFPDLLVAVDKIRYTGRITIDVLNGRVKQVDLGAPVRLTIVESDAALDKGGGPG